MKITAPLLALAILFLPLAPQVEADNIQADIVDTAVEAGSFQTLVAAVKAAGLVDALKGEGPFTVFAPTDEAFAALPEGTVASLLKPEKLPTLKRILTFHVVKGRVLSSDLLPVQKAKTLAGADLPIGLRVGKANVIKADIECSNGVIHVIDSVLLPPEPKRAKKMMPARRSRIDVEDAIYEAIDRGVPVFNKGDHKGCAAIYRTAAQHILHAGGDALPDLARWDLERTLKMKAHDAAEEAWNLRHAFDRTLADMAFKPRMEAALPKGFPAAGPVGKVVRKEYPVYRMARAKGGAAFWTLFQHIKKNKVEMTAPVEMTMGEGMRMKDMAFLYEHPEQGKSGQQGNVAVLDLEPVEVLSIGMRGRRNNDMIAVAKQLIEKRMKADGLEAAGDWRLMGYNSPMVPRDQQFWELQIPISR